MPDKIMIFIPTYNCENQIARVLTKIDEDVQSLVQEIVIIDNRSLDATRDVARNAAARLTVKTTLLQNLENYSLGGSIKRAFLYAIEQGYDYLIVLHGDDQADVRDLLPVLKSGAYREQDLMIGARFHPLSKLNGYSFVRTSGNKVLNYACGLISRRRVYDMIAGLNIYNVNYFRSLFFMKFPDNLTFDAHILLYAFAHKARVRYIPISWREEDQISNAKVVRQAMTILRLFVDYVGRGKAIFAVDKSGRAPGFQYDSAVIFQK